MILQGPVSGIALDAGKVLADAIRKERGSNEEDLFDFKHIVLRELGGMATTVLLDPVYGPDLLDVYPPGCLPMFAYEADATLISKKERITLMPAGITIKAIKNEGVELLKFFMYYAPDDDPVLNRRKLQQIALVGSVCEDNNMGFLLEPLVYHPTIKAGSAEYAKIKPDLVRRATQAFSDPELKASMLKVEFPVDLDFVKGYGEPVMSRNEAIEAYQQAAGAANGLDILYLSAGVTFDRFVESLELAKEAGVGFRGFMCGRAIWADGINEFGRGKEGRLRIWLDRFGRERMKTLNALLK